MDQQQSEQHHFLQGKTIIVAGGGIAGSAFVVGLRKFWNPSLEPPTVIIYERDSPDVTAQREGYTVSVTGHETSGGLLALRRLGMLEQTLEKAVSGHNGQGAFKIWGPRWNERASVRREPIDGLPSASVRIPRKDLRKVLHDNLGVNDTVQWNARCTFARRLEDGRVRVRVARGRPEEERVAEEDCDLLIAADGASSRLRACLRPDDNLNFAGAILRGGISRFDGPPPAPLDKDWGFIISGTGVSCFFSPNDKNSVVWGVGHLEAEQIPQLDLSNEKMVQDLIQQSLELGERLDEPFKSIVEHTDPKTVFAINAREKAPFYHQDVDSLRVVFIGDSNHALSPFAGYGANLALSDASDLAEQLCKGETLGKAMSSYDKLAVPRSIRILERAQKGLREFHIEE
ncbi:hypothetical protein F66182_5380 [Fusarium sp. NRRL 66182]|nr:hypothetical protein F66182_5380 [Fusarium sp. NRRL 66182]